MADKCLNSQCTPIDSYFYGDFGLSLANGSSILNVLAQLNYTNGIIPGYIVHVSPYGITNGSYIQIGLTPSNITTIGAIGSIFPMAGQDTNTLFPNSNLPTYSNGQAITSTMHIGSNSFTNIGVNLDTGPPTPNIHNPSSGGVPTDLISNDGNSLIGGIPLTLSATNTNGNASTFFSLTSGTNYGNNQVNISADNNAFYINAGITAFYGNDVMYDLADGTVGITQAVPEPSSFWLLTLTAAGMIPVCRRRANNSVSTKKVT